VPDEVGSLQFDDVSDRAVKVIWSEPKQINGVLTGYQLTYMVKDRSETLKVENLTSDTLNVMVNNLQVWSGVQATGHSNFLECVKLTSW
jgi:protein sidekick